MHQRSGKKQMFVGQVFCFLGAAAVSDVCLLRRLGLEPAADRLSNMDFLGRRRPQRHTSESIYTDIHTFVGLGS